MCGLSAIFGYGAAAPPVAESELAAITDSMARRGPDGAGTWRGETANIGLGHRRLAIIDTSETANQPLVIEGGRYRIVYNGEIYNYRELAQDLAARGVRFDTRSDTEVLLRLYALDGPAMLPRLRGMYTFAIWDEAERTLFAARDPLGIKPLYYADDGATLRIASQVKALAAGSAVDATHDPAAVVGFHLWGFVPEPFTMLAGVKPLPAGHHLLCRAGGVPKVARHFDLAATFEAAAAAPAPRDPARIAEAVRASLIHHFVSDVPVSLFLSAGVDSAVLASLAAELDPPGFAAVTLGFEEFAGGPLDEAPLAAATAASLGIEHRPQIVRRADFADLRADILAAMDQPSIDGVNVYLVARAGAQAGFKVALSGLGGDEMFGGYPSFTQIPKLTSGPGRLGAIPGLGAAFRTVTAPIARQLTSPKYAGLIEYGRDTADAFLLRRGLYMPWELPEVLDPDLVRAGLQRLDTRNALTRTLPASASQHAQIAALEAGWYMKNQLLRDADWASMAHSLELRVPLADAHLTAALAPMIASAQPPRKADLAGVAGTRLPDAARNRPKSGFYVPVRDWLAEDAPQARGLRGWAGLIAGEWRATR